MKKRLLMYAFFFVCAQNAYAQQPTSITEGSIARIPSRDETVGGAWMYLNDKVGKHVSITCNIFVETSNKMSTELITGVGPAYSTDNCSIGVMIGCANIQKVWAVTPYTYLQTKNSRLSIFAMGMIDAEKTTLMFEGLYCFKSKFFPGYDFGAGVINLRSLAGPYLRVAKGDFYVGFNVGFPVLPNLEYGEKMEAVELPVPAEHGSSSGYVIQLIFGKEIINRCKNCDK